MLKVLLIFSLTIYTSGISVVEDDSKKLSVCIKNVISNVTTNVMHIGNALVVGMNELDGSLIHEANALRFIVKSPDFDMSNVSLHIGVYVICVQNLTQLKTNLEVVRKGPHWNPYAVYVIKIEKVENLKMLTDYLIFSAILNVSMLIKNDKDYDVYSFESPIILCHNKSKTVLVKKSECKNDDVQKILPKIDIKRLAGCRFKLAAHNTFPLIDFDRNHPAGIEQILIKYFEIFTKIKIDLVQYHTKITSDGEVVKNYTVADIFQDVYDGKVEGTVGSYFLHETAADTLSFTYPVIIDNMVLIVSRARILDLWESTFARTQYPCLILVVLYLTFSIFACTLKIFPKQRPDCVRNFIIIFGMMINQGIYMKTKRVLAVRFVLTSMSVTALLMPYLLQAFLASAKTSPIRGYEPQDVDEINRDYEVVRPKEFMNRSRACFTRLECLKLVNDCKDRKHFTDMSKIVYESYKWRIANDQCEVDVYVSKHEVSVLLRTIYLRRGSLLTIPFNMFLSRITVTGLLVRDLHRIFTLQKLRCVIDESSMSHLKFPFSVLFYGIILSTFVFGIELYMNTRVFLQY